MINRKELDGLSPEFQISQNEKRILLKFARESIISNLESNKEKTDETSEIPEVMKLERGLFVTLRKDNNLRGCIGHIIPMGTLCEEIPKIAVMAAQEDPRFPSVVLSEVEDLTLEITILSPMLKISNPNMVKPGKHGLLIKNGFYQGLLLPQVAIDYNWNREEFLSQTCLKAGLHSDAWKDDETEISVFTAEYFEEGN